MTCISLRCASTAASTCRRWSRAADGGAAAAFAFNVTVTCKEAPGEQACSGALPDTSLRRLLSGLDRGLRRRRQPSVPLTSDPALMLACLPAPTCAEEKLAGLATFLTVRINYGGTLFLSKVGG